ncbi:hypothetical protein GOV12_02895 [Candidatus Pacearchaeota archaeon]|nr:hypothetical protein [Candidatus Pacearchaeota archaeon]
MKKKCNITFIIVFIIIILFLQPLNASTLKVTNEHPFLINNQWIPAKNLNPGDLITTVDGKLAKITSIQDIKLTNPVKVFNLESGTFHNFVVTNQGLIVHNKPMHYSNPSISTPTQRIGFMDRFFNLFRSKSGRFKAIYMKKFKCKYPGLLKEISKLKVGEFNKLPEGITDEELLLVKAYFTYLGRKFDVEFSLEGKLLDNSIDYYIIRGSRASLDFPAGFKDAPGKRSINYHNHNGIGIHFDGKLDIYYIDGTAFPSGKMFSDEGSDLMTRLLGEMKTSDIVSMSKAGIKTGEIGIITKKGDFRLVKYKVPTVDEWKNIHASEPRWEQINSVNDINLNVVEFLYGPEWKKIYQIDKYPLHELKQLQHPVDGFNLVDGVDLKNPCLINPY